MPQHKQFLSNLFVIPKKIGDLRPVINKKTQNEFVQYHCFKKEGLNSLLDYLSGSEFLTAIEIKDAFVGPKGFHQRNEAFCVGCL